jgi:hypothetical protein
MTIIEGQALCLLLTLLVVPVAYSYLAEFEALAWAEVVRMILGRTRESVRDSHVE